MFVSHCESRQLIERKTVFLANLQCLFLIEINY